MSVIKHMHSADKREAGDSGWQRQLLDSLPSGFLMVDADRNIVLANTRALAMLDRKSSVVVGRPVSSVLKLHNATTGSRVDLEALFLRVKFGEQPVHLDNCLINASKEGGTEVALTVLPAEGSQDGRQSLTLVLDEAAAVGEALKLRDAILSMVSHELRTPLLHIKGFVSSLLESDIEWDEETRLDFLRTIDREADRLTAMVSGLMEISRMGTGELPLHLELADPYQLTYAAIDEASPFLRRHRAIVTVPEGLSKIRIDALRVMGVLVNLIENASKYSESGSAITLGAEEKAGEIVFSVRDEGVGVPGEIQKAIFEMFYRGDHAGKRPAGTGLGLAVCKAVVEAHRGKIWVDSDGKGGSTFYFTLPVAVNPRQQKHPSKRGGISRPRRSEMHEEKVITGI